MSIPEERRISSLEYAINELYVILLDSTDDKATIDYVEQIIENLKPFYHTGLFGGWTFNEQGE